VTSPKNTTERLQPADGPRDLPQGDAATGRCVPEIGVRTWKLWLTKAAARDRVVLSPAAAVELAALLERLAAERPLQANR
jgi:hypothetical protein